ncbi:MAG: RES family NAD+ phosphorylase [Candidatus Omnitrophica bacterium]|nr:RES family NAD+ phosphorylase [Candidatus Omnitrophota bacterium]
MPKHKKRNKASRKTAPMQFDIPATNQLFGQFVYEAGIQGILYPSRFDGKECLAIYTQNFKNSKSFIELSDTTPSPSVVRRIDANKTTAY